MGLFDFFKKSSDRYTFRGEDGKKYFNPPGQHIIILKDCMELLEKTTSPGTFFSRAKLAQEKAYYCRFEKEIVWNGMNSEQIFQMLNNRESVAWLHRKFIDRLFETGKEDNLTYQMREFGKNMNEQTLNYFLQRLNGKMYHFCKISFSDTDKLYTYITKDPSIRVGDLVTIPVSTSFGPGSDLVQVANVFDAPLDDLEFPIYQLRCVKNKFNNLDFINMQQ